MSFWIDKPDISVLTHDSNSRFGIIRSSTRFLRDALKKPDVSEEEVSRYISWIEDAVKDLMEIQDNFWTKEKAKYDTTK